MLKKLKEWWDLTVGAVVLLSIIAFVLLVVYGFFWLVTFKYRECREFGHTVLYCIAR